MGNYSPQVAGNITHMIPRLRSGSVRLNNFVSQNYSLTDLKEEEDKKLIMIPGTKFNHIHFLRLNIVYIKTTIVSIIAITIQNERG
jgi:hypothetical protein